MRGVNSDQNIVIAPFLNIMFLYCTLQDFSYLSKPFCARILESASVGHISLKVEFKRPKDVSESLQLNSLWIAAQNIKKL